MSLDPATLLLEQFDHLLTTPEAVDELNRAILTLAVQGKLVEQDPNDEKVCETLKKLQSSESQSFTNSAVGIEKPFDLPSNWEWRTIGDICQTTSGGTPNRQNHEYFDGTIPWVKSGELKDMMIEKVEETITESGLANSSAKIFSAGTPLIALYGATVGRTGLLGIDAATNQAVCAIFNPKEVLDTQFLLKYLQSQRPNLINISAGGAQPNISQKVIREWLIPLPPLAEQKRIVARVEALFAQTRQLAEKLARAQHDLVQINQSALAHLLAAETPEAFARQWDFIAKHFDSLFTEPEHITPLRQAILELAVRGKLTRRESTDEPASALLARIHAEKAKAGKAEFLPPVKASEQPFELPEGWEWVRLKQITTTLQTGPFGSNLHKSDYISNGIPVVNPINMQDGKIVPLSEMMVSEKTRERLSQYILKTGDLVLARRGEIGRCALVTEQEDGWLCGTGSLRLKLAENISKQFIILLFQTDFARSRLTRETVGITMSNMSQTTLENLIFALPPLTEQQCIVAKVEQLLGLCDALEAKLRSAREERIRLTAAVLAGVGNGSGVKLEKPG